MRGSHTKAEPEALTDWLALDSANWKPSYPFPNDIRQPIIRSLVKAQRGLCVYCGRKLDLSSAGTSFHVEHFRPQNTHPELATCFANLFLSCGQEAIGGNRSETCGTAKDNWFDELCHIEPEYPACTRRFLFSSTGEILPRELGDNAAVAMIRKLNLNHRELQREREEIYYLLDGIGDEELSVADFLDEESGIAESFAHMVCQYFETTIP